MHQWGLNLDFFFLNTRFHASFFLIFILPVFLSSVARARENIFKDGWLLCDSENIKLFSILLMYSLNSVESLPNISFKHNTL